MINAINRDKIVRYAIVRREEKRDVAEVLVFAEQASRENRCGPNCRSMVSPSALAKSKVRCPYCRAFRVFAAARRHSKFDNPLRQSSSQVEKVLVQYGMRSEWCEQTPLHPARIPPCPRASESMAHQW